jgi:hypothetical protein
MSNSAFENALGVAGLTPLADPGVAWAATTGKTAGDRIKVVDAMYGNLVFEAFSTGTTGGTEPAWVVSDTVLGLVTDASVQWLLIGIVGGADQRPTTIALGLLMEGSVPALVVPEIADLPTSDTTTTKVLSPDGTGGVAWRAEAGGGGLPAAKGWLSGNFAAEDIPASPNATYDDEFDDTTGMSGATNGLDARWNWRNQSTATATFTKAGWLTLSCPAQSSDNWRILEIAAMADGTYEALISIEGSDTSAGAVRYAGAVVLVDGTNGDFYAVGKANEGGSLVISVQRWSSVTSWGANEKILNNPGYLANRLYVRVVKASTTLDFWASEDGIGWTKLVTVSDSVSVDRIGVAVSENGNDGQAKLHVDYLRKVA